MHAGKFIMSTEDMFAERYSANTWERKYTID